MSLRKAWGAGGIAVLVLMTSPVRAAEGPAERQSLEELRNTVVNLLQALVDKGLLTREQAQQLVKQAQDKASADAKALASNEAAQAAAEQNAVRVPYVPQIIKDEISKQVAEEVKPGVVKDVIQEAKTEKWGVPGALPAWLAGVSVFGDVTVRGQADLFPSDNSFQQLLDINAVNAAGGIARATYPYLDTTDDRYRLRLRARLGVHAELSPNVEAVVRLASGSLTNVVAGSESQTEGVYGNRYTIGIDEGYIVWHTNLADLLSMNTLEGGRLANPWFSPSELVFARDLTFEGVSDTVRLGWGVGGPDKSHVFLTAGAFPMLEVPLQASADKWMLGAQIGAHLRFNDGTDHLTVAGAYYDFLKVTGQKNQLFSTLLNYTAQPFVQFGNTVYDISNTTDPTTNLLGLAAHFRVADLAATYDHSFGRYSIALTGEAVRNIGYNLQAVEALSNLSFDSPQNRGYSGELSFGDGVVDAFGRWRAAIGYKYVQADAVLDEWTDADFHGGGTNASGYYFWGSVGLTHNTWARLRYLGADQITGPRYGLDIWQLDFNARF